MAFSRKKPAPTRRGRARPAEPAATETVAGSPTEPEAEAESAAEAVVSRPSAAPSTGGGLEMALIVVTFVTLVAAFVLLQLEMHKAFDEGWPI